MAPGETVEPVETGEDAAGGETVEDVRSSRGAWGTIGAAVVREMTPSPKRYFSCRFLIASAAVVLFLFVIPFGS